MQNRKKVQEAKVNDAIIFVAEEEKEVMAKYHLEIKSVINTLKHHGAVENKTA